MLSFAFGSLGSLFGINTGSQLKQEIVELYGATADQCNMACVRCQVFDQLQLSRP